MASETGCTGPGCSPLLQGSGKVPWVKQVGSGHAWPAPEDRQWVGLSADEGAMCSHNDVY